VALASKRLAPRTSLGTTVFAAEFLDELWPILLLLGFGLWRSLPATLVIEFSIYVGGLAIYLRTTRARDRVGSWGLSAMIVVLAALYLSSLVSPPPPGEHALAITTLGLWLFIPWGWWVDRHRDLARESVA
jgi:hypothetical protein